MLRGVVILIVFLVFTDLIQGSAARGPEVRINGPIGFLLFPIARGLMRVRSFEIAFVVLRPLFVLNFLVQYLNPGKWAVITLAVLWAVGLSICVISIIRYVRWERSQKKQRWR